MSKSGTRVSGVARGAALSPARVVRAAVGLADRRGLAGLTMRLLARTLGVAPMSLYHHVPSRAALLARMMEAVLAEAVQAEERCPVPGRDWRAALRQRAHGRLAVLGRHPWALALQAGGAARKPAASPGQDALAGLLRQAGFRGTDAVQALRALEGYTLGYALQAQYGRPPSRAVGAGDYAFGLELLLTELERLRTGAAWPRGP